MSEAARSRRDLPRYEPQFGTPASDGVAGSDPLAELARLVGQDDPFRHVFQPAQGSDVTHQAREADPAVQQDYDDEPLEEAGDADHHWSGHDETDSVDHEAHEAGTLADERYYAGQVAAHPDEAGIADQHEAPEAADAALSAIPDLWARDDGHLDGYAPPIDAFTEDEPSFDRSIDRTSARRPLVVLAAVLLLTGGGLAATYLVKGNAAPSGLLSARGEAPTIMAAAGPTKVKLDDAGATAPEDQDAALLNKNANAATGPVKVVTSQEQPVDLGQLPKSPDLAEGAQPIPQAPSPFPEPKKVKTFLVHLDGTTLPGDGAPPAPKPSAVPPAASAAPETGAALPATPRTPAKGSTTPKAMTIASLAADPAASDETTAPPARSPKQPASPGVHAAAKPTEAADTGATPASGFGLQLAASPSEADAQAAFAKLKKKYPAQLGAYTASIHRSETGDKPVYRVRVGGLSQTDAKTLCSQLQSSGGSCFVVHN